MLTELSNYYQKQGILSLDFGCQHLQACRNGNNRFAEAKAAFVGSEYEKGTLPRLLFASLDPGRSDSDPNQRTVNAVRLQEERDCVVEALPKARHWYRTHELACILLKKIKPHLQMQDSHLYFAHVNSVKCCENNEDHKSGSRVLFKNCQKYIGGEISILKPDILVTQGQMAREAIEESFNTTGPSKDNDACSHAWPVIGGKKALWFHTYHPRNFGKFNRQRRDCFDDWAGLVYETFRGWRCEKL
jgi:uracil-DNA glycosylase